MKRLRPNRMLKIAKRRRRVARKWHCHQLWMRFYPRPSLLRRRLITLSNWHRLEVRSESTKRAVSNPKLRKRSIRKLKRKKSLRNQIQVSLTKLKSSSPRHLPPLNPSLTSLKRLSPRSQKLRKRMLLLRILKSPPKILRLRKRNLMIKSLQSKKSIITRSTPIRNIIKSIQKSI